MQPTPPQVSLLGEAVSRHDLIAVYEILVITGYKDDEGTDNEVSLLNTFLYIMYQVLETFKTGIWYSFLSSRIRPTLYDIAVSHCLVNEFFGISHGFWGMYNRALTSFLVWRIFYNK